MRKLGDDKHIHHEVDRLFTKLIHNPWRRAAPIWAPSVDMYEKDGRYVLEVELSGVEQDELSVLIEGRTLTVCGVRQESRTMQEAGRFYYAERKFGRFCRVLVLPDDADVPNMEKSFEHGVLRLTFPKLGRRRRMF